jgi:DNA-binding MarR family transcriptional regulator
MDPQSAPDRLRALPSWLLGQASARARRVVGEVLADEGLHRSQFALMASLEQFGSLSQSALSERSGLDRSDVVRWIDDLAGQGLVERSQDPTDRRRNVISLTDQGRRRLTDLDLKLNRAQQELLTALTPDERAQLVQLLGRVLTAPHTPR